MNISNRLISKSFSPYVIAELSANHNGNIEKAFQLINAAKKHGADAVKIQTYSPDTMTIDSNKEDFKIKSGLWKDYKLYDLYKDAHTPFEWHKDLFSYANKIGITLFSSPFDETAVDLLEDLGAPAYKVASFEICDIPLISYIARTKKPILMSTGMASLNEIEEAVITAKNYGSKDILLFHCVSAYPAPIKEANLKNLVFLKEKFNLEVGLSDHTIGNTAAIASVALGASAIEKHFTLDRSEKGPDSEFSVEPKELLELKEITHQTWLATKDSFFKRSKTELENKVFRRSLYFVKDLKKGSIIQKNDIKRIRPGFGLEPKHQEKVIGKTLNKDVERGDSVSWDILDQS